MLEPDPVESCPGNILPFRPAAQAMELFARPRPAVMLVRGGVARCWTSEGAFAAELHSEIVGQMLARAEQALADAERALARARANAESAAELAAVRILQRGDFCGRSRRSLITRLRRRRAARTRRTLALLRQGATLAAFAGWAAAILVWALETGA